MVSEAMMQAGAQAVQDISSAMFKAAGECLTLHGPDPHSGAILGAAFCMTIDKITTEIDPTFKRRMLEQLSRAA